MADEANKEEQSGGKKKLPMRLIMIVGAVMLLEGVVFGGIYMLFIHEPQAAQADPLRADALAEQEEVVEILLIQDKFQNTRQGSQAYLYDASIYVLAKRKNQGHVEDVIQDNMQRVRQDITQIFAKAEPAHLNEPERQTLKRHILAACEAHFGTDAENEPYITDVIISDWKRFSTDL